MYEGWFGGWFGGWYSEWFGGTSDVPVPPVVVTGGNKDLAEKPRKRRAAADLTFDGRQGAQAGAAILQPIIIVHAAGSQAEAGGVYLEFERAPVVLPPVKRQPSVAFTPRGSVDTIGEYIPRPRPPIQHPSPKAPTRPQRQKARRKQPVEEHQNSQDVEDLLKIIGKLL